MVGRVPQNYFGVLFTVLPDPCPSVASILIAPSGLGAHADSVLRQSPDLTARKGPPPPHLSLLDHAQLWTVRYEIVTLPKSRTESACISTISNLG